MSAAVFSPPIVQQCGKITVVREDMVPGGTKARFIDALFDDVDELVYASPTQGGAQTALALSARRLGKKLTLFVAASTDWHPRLVLSRRLGAKIVEVEMGYLTNVQARAARYSNTQRVLRRRRVRNLEFGLGSQAFIDKIAEAASQIPRPEQLWCAAGSGTLARGLAAAWPDVPRFVVQVGHKLTRYEAAYGTVVVFPKSYAYQEKREPPFPSDPTYERKAYFTMLDHIGDSRATFWNTACSATEEIERCR
jgi:1-aminocyclopropane-1-carboxylate deaminase/D-cysteine desulfhydrase-like pyridoxal-dependent ACC family enzyme